MKLHPSNSLHPANTHTQIHRALTWVVCVALFCAVGMIQPYKAFAAGPRYVTPTGTDLGDCSTLSLPCKTIQYAIGQSFPGEQIRIAAGIYTSTDLQVMYVAHALTISGGWDAATFTTQNGSTIIDAQQARRAVYVASDVTASLEHLTLRNGMTAGQGAGLYAAPNSPLILTNVVLQQNVADNSGGGVYVEAAISLINSQFENNSTTNGVGGGLYANAQATLLNTNFISNVAPYGGGAYSRGLATIQGGRFAQNVADGGAGMLVSSTLHLADTVFVGNIASGFGGGGIYVDGTAVITNPRFIDNQTGAGAGGGLYVRNVLTMTGAEFRGNSASFGGGAYTRLSAQISGGVFVTNSSTAGGGLFAAQPIILSNVSFVNNTSTVSGGGGVYAPEDIWVVQGQFEGNRSAASGGGIYAGQMVTVSNTAFHANIAELGGGLFANQDALLAQVSFDGNTSNGGAGMYGIGPLTATAVSFVNNSATGAPGNGGGLYAASTAQINKSIVQNNTCTDPGCLGGGLYLGSGGNVQQTRFIRNVAPKGGAAFLLNGDVAISNTLFAANFASTLSGSALYLNSPGKVRLLHSTIASPTLSAGTAIYISNGTANITNTIIASQSLAIHANGGLVYEDGNLFYAVTSRTAGLVAQGSNSFVGHPAFVDPNTDDYHLRGSSMAINRGLTSAATTDLDDDTRPQNAAPDIGMDETVYATADDVAVSQSAAVSAALPGDIITYTLRFTNFSQLATSVVLTDLFGANLQVLSVSPSIVITATPGNTHVWLLPDLAFGESGSIIVRVRVNPALSAPTSIAQTTIIGSARDNNATNNSATINTLILMPITGLSTSSSTVQLGSATPFTANISGGSNVTYTWAFGDGSTDTGANVSHIYASVGAYTVAVTATNGLSTVTQTMQVQVNEVPVSGLVINNNVGGSAPVGTQVTFTGQIGAGSNVTYTWLVDGVVVGSGPSLPYVFNTPGAHTVTLIAGNGAGTQTGTTTITVTGNAALNRKLYLPLMRVTSR